VARPGQAWILDRPVLPPVCARTSHRWPSVRMYTSRRPRELRFPFHQCRSVLTRRTYSAGRREEILTARDRAWPSSPRHPPNTHHHTAAVRRSPGRLSSGAPASAVVPLTRHLPDRYELAIHPRKADDLYTRPRTWRTRLEGVSAVAAGIPRKRHDEASPQLTDAQLKDLASEHFTYEVVHLVTALTWVVRLKARGDHASPTHNLCVEGVLLHARALADFLRSTRTKLDDLLATDYLSTWERLETLHGDLRDRINKQVPHLTTTRLDKQGFDLAGIAGDVLRGVIKFVEQVVAERREWFAQAEQLARAMLAQLPPAAARPRYSPMNAPAFPIDRT